MGTDYCMVLHVIIALLLQTGQLTVLALVYIVVDVLSLSVVVSPTALLNNNDTCIVHVVPWNNVGGAVVHVCIKLYSVVIMMGSSERQNTIIAPALCLSCLWGEHMLSILLLAIQFTLDTIFYWLVVTMVITIFTWKTYVVWLNWLLLKLHVHIMLGLWFPVMFCYSAICLGVTITKAMASSGKIQQTTVYVVYLVVALIRWFGESHKYISPNYVNVHHLGCKHGFLSIQFKNFANCIFGVNHPIFDSPVISHIWHIQCGNVPGKHLKFAGHLLEI